MDEEILWSLILLLWIASLITCVAFVVYPLQPGFEDPFLSVCCCFSGVTMSYIALKPIISQKQMKFQKGMKNHANII